MRGRRGLTLIELLLALAVTALLVGALTSSLYVMTRAVDGGGSAASAVYEAAPLLDEMAENLQLAVTFTERTSTAVTFSVPDRTGDGVPDTIRYAWAGPPAAADVTGSRLTMQVNGGDPVTLAENAVNVAFSYDVTMIAGTGGTSEQGDAGSVRVLFVVGRTDSLGSQEAVRQFLLESWGYTVATIDDDALQAEYDAAFAVNDVVYVSDQVNAGSLADKLRLAPIGVVDESRDQALDLGVADTRFGSQNGASIFVDDNTHYITKPFYPGLLPVLTAADPLIYADGTLADGAAALAYEPGDAGRPMLVTVEAGARLSDGTPAPARRVVMPWGANIDFSLVNADGLTLLKRSLQWAALLEVDDAVESPLFAQNEDPEAAAKDYQIRSDKWAVASIVPDLPPDAISWKVTRFRFIAKQRNSPTETLVLQVRRRGAGGEPLADVLAQTFMFESDLPVDYGWVEASFTMTDTFAPDEGACIAIGMLSGTDGGTVLYDSGNGATTPADQFVHGKPGAWDAVNATEDIPCQVDGTVDVPVSP